ncbi:MAG: outer membrane beta-barrel protein [Gemmatimonadales bacterium]
MALAAFAAMPAAAQLAGMPVWNNPKGGTGITIDGDFASNNDDAGGGNAFGARASVGLANLTLGAGLATWDSDLSNDKITTFAANAGFRLIGGSLLPVAVNLQVGAGRSNEVSSGVPGSPIPAITTLTASVGLSTSVPTPGFSIEPYVSPGIRYYKASDAPTGFDDTESNFGFTIGANVNFGMFGVHLAYDSESNNGASSGIFGIGAHVALKAPIGM